MVSATPEGVPEDMSSPAPTESPVSNDSGSTQENDGSQESTQQQSPDNLKEQMAELQRRLDGRLKKEKELDQSIQEKEERLQKIEENIAPVPEQGPQADLPDELVGKFDGDQLEAINTLVKHRLQKDVPDVLQSDETLQKIASKNAKEDEASLSSFKQSYPDAYQGDDLAKDMDPSVQQTLESLMKVDKTTPVGELAELAYMKTYPGKYKEKIQSSDYQSVQSYKDQQLVGGGSRRAIKERDPVFNDAESKLLDKFGISKEKRKKI